MGLLLQITCVQRLHFMGYATSRMEIVCCQGFLLAHDHLQAPLSFRAASLNLNQPFSLPFGGTVKTRHKQKGSTFIEPETSSSKCLSPASIATAQ